MELTDEEVARIGGPLSDCEGWMSHKALQCARGHEYTCWLAFRRHGATVVLENAQVLTCPECGAEAVVLEKPASVGRPRRRRRQ